MELTLNASPDAVVPTPADSPLATSPFEAVPAGLRAPLEARGFTELSAVQRAVLAGEVGERDLQISSQTGSGKTVALGFVLAASFDRPAADQPRTMERPAGPEALIIVPTRELATQVCEELSWLFGELRDVRVGSVTGGTPLPRDHQMLRRRPRVLVGTPGRLLDHVRTRALDLSSVRQLVLDEADQMLDMGFREELEGILDKTPETRRTHLVSATFPEGIQRLAARYQSDPVAIEGTRLGHANQDIEHVGYMVDPRQRYGALVNLLLQANDERTLVFVERRSDALEVASKLEADGFAALPLSGELAQRQRERTLAAFRAGRATVLVATDVAARGLDVPDVATVIHTSPPMDDQVYTHRSGRTGRAGKRGRSVLIAAPNRKRRVERLLSSAGVRLSWLPVPGAAEVRANQLARNRQELEAGLASALAEAPAPEHLEHASELLEGREAASVVAALLARLEPSSQAKPQDVRAQVEAPSERFDTRRPQRGQDGPGYRGRPDRYQSDRRPNDRYQGGRDSYDRGQYDRNSSGRGQNGHGRPAHGSSVRFFINWGHNQGANPSRLLAAICRRGQVDGQSIGSIAIHPNASTFDVGTDVVERFERLAGRKDPRDPQVLIRRDRGPLPTQRRR